jgi:hypothetical protein
MDPITLAIVAALASGAATGVTEPATMAIRDAYGGLKTWIQQRYPTVSLDQLEQHPASEARRQVVAEDLKREGIAGDTELIQRAQTVVDLVRQHAPDVARSIGVDIGELDRATATFGNVLAGRDATGVRMQNVTDSNLQFGDITASGIDSLKKA